MNPFNERHKTQAIRPQNPYVSNLSCGVCLQNTYDYSPFGVSLDGRTLESDFYRRGFNGMEKDDEVTGKGNSYDFGARLFHPRSATWYSVDQFEHKFPSWSSFNFCYNNPIVYIDPDGHSPKTHILNGLTGESIYINDGKNDIVVVKDEDYMTTVQSGLSYEGISKIDKLKHKNVLVSTHRKLYESHLAKGVKHTANSFNTGSSSANANIMSLDPRARIPMILSVLQARIEGIDVRGAALGGHRTSEQQDALYAKGRTQPGKIVTNAKAGQSNHNFGLSMDVAIFENDNYLSKGSEWQYQRFGEIAENNGLEWGGRWSKPYDPAHVQIKHGYSMSELRGLPKKGTGFIDAPLIKEK